tara:strand:+ start:471 stop:1661 length:1191 start_codon:yes stop_codon:yes gene_type:complete
MSTEGSTTYKIIQGLAQAAANAYDGVHDERYTLDGQVRNMKMKREEGEPLIDKRVIDGFSVKFFGDKLCLHYHSEVMLKQIYSGNFENDISAMLNEIKKFLQKEYKAITGESVTLTKSGEVKIYTASSSRVRSWVQAHQFYKISGIKSEQSIQGSDGRTVDDAIKSFLELNNKNKRPENDTRKKEKIAESRNQRSPEGQLGTYAFSGMTAAQRAAHQNATIADMKAKAARGEALSNLAKKFENKPRAAEVVKDPLEKFLILNRAYDDFSDILNNKLGQAYELPSGSDFNKHIKYDFEGLMARLVAGAQGNKEEIGKFYRDISHVIGELKRLQQMVSSPKLRKRAIEELGLKKKPGMVGKAMSRLKSTFGMEEDISLPSKQSRLKETKTRVKVKKQK